jgi:hypothetical protein
VERDQFEELLLGLELTGMPFLAALKPSAGYEPIKLPLPEGRVKKKKTKKNIPAQLTMVQGGPKLFLTEEVEETQEVGGGFD